MRKTKEQCYQENLKRLKNYRPIDDDFMRELFRNNIPLAEMVLRIITGKQDLVITSQETQYDMNRLLGARSICLDVLATDSNGRKYNLEIQRDDKGASPKRARYHSSAMDIEFLNAKDDFSKLPITYTIFITENDIRGEGRAIYHFEWIDSHSGKPLGDEAHIIFVNSSYNNSEDNSDIAKLTHDFRCSDAGDMKLSLLAERTKYFKETIEGVSYMCRINEEMCNEAAQDAKYENSVDIALKMLSKGKLTIEEISEYSGLTIEEIKDLDKQIKNDNFEL